MMSEVEQLAQEQFSTFRNRLCEMLSEIEEEHKSAFMQGYAKGETDEKFKAKQEIADLEQKLEQTEKDLSDYQFNYPTIKELQKENAELTCQMKRNVYCYSCTNATEKCYKKEIGCPCGNYKSYKDENAELKNRDCWKSCEYANPKSELIGQHIKDVQNLTKAKELLNDFICYANLDDCNLYINEQAEQFLKEVSDK